MSKLIGIDVGGTFTDIVYYDSERDNTLIHKVPSNNADPSIAILRGLAEICERNSIDPGEIDKIYHGTTVATNALLEYKGSETGMITTRGFRDVLHIGRHQRPEHYSIRQEIPWQSRPLVKRQYRKTVNERITPPSGNILVALAEEEVRVIARYFKKEDVKSIAICFLFSYLNPEHEERARELVLEEYPGAYVTTSSSVSAQFREFERFTSCAVNAFIGPLIRDYINRLTEKLVNSGFICQLHIMLSNGGLATAKMVSDLPVKTLLSGPAAGVLCGIRAGQTSGRNKLITFDVGGTSADLCLLDDGKYNEASARDTWIAGYPVLVPMIDIHTIGAGGGSIAYVDGGGTFRVGPESAGAQPGPAAYNRGGQMPTTTDANVVLGRLDKENFLGGEMDLDIDASFRVIGELAKNLNLGVEEAAEGVITILNNNMANAIRSRTIQKGHDPREYSLVAFGGCGPLHAVEVANILNIPEVIVPEFPGIGSAIGLLTTDIKYDLVKSELQESGSLNLERLNENLDSIRKSLESQYSEDGISAENVVFKRYVELRYSGQGYELRINIPSGEIDRSVIDKVFDSFHQQHNLEYGHSFPDMPIEIVNTRVMGFAATDKIGMPETQQDGSLKSALIKKKDCIFRVNGKLDTFVTAFYHRNLLPVSEQLEGPAIILQKDTTIIVPPQTGFVRHPGGDLIINFSE